MATPYDTIKAAIIGNPPQLNKKPSRQGVVKAFAEMQVQMEGAQSGALIRDTKANLVLLLAAPVSAMAWVTNDPVLANNGIYQNTGTAVAAVWTRRGPIPQFLITGINSGAGTADAIQVTTDLPLPDEDGRALIVFNVLAANMITPPTISINGGAALPIVSNNGVNVVPSGLTVGSYPAGFVASGKFRLLSDQASAALFAQMEALYVDFTEKYRGAFTDDAAASAGTPPVEGSLYFNSTTDTLMVFRSGVWVIGEGQPGPQGDPGPQGIQGERDTRNFFWQGSFDNARRGTSIVGTAGRIGTLDGCTIARTSGATGVTESQQQGSRGTNFCKRTLRTAGDAQTNAINSVMPLGIDDSRPLAGKQAILSYRARCAVRSATVTISNASPGVITWTAHGLTVDKPINFTTTGALPTGLLPGVNYYVKTVLTANTFTVSATIGGAAINTTSAGSGTHTANASDYSGAAGALTIALKTSNSLIEQAINLTNGNYTTGDNTAASASIVITSLWQNFTLPVTFLSDVTQVAARFQEIPVGTAGAADGFEVEELQLQLGTVASTFVPIDPAYSQIKAQREYMKSYDPDVVPGTAANYAGCLGNLSVGTAVANGVMMEAQFSAMRAQPTVVVYSPQTGAAGMMARGSLADIAATVAHIGRGGFRIWNNALTVDADDYYVHYTAEARL